MLAVRLSLALGLLVGAAGADPPAIPILARTDLELTISYPADGSGADGASCGAFVAGRAGVVPRPLDIAIAIDTSSSTAAPSGADIDGDGVVGEPVIAAADRPVVPASSDPGDSILAAEVGAARSVVRALTTSARAAVVTFSSERSKLDFFWNKPAVVTRSDLDADLEEIDAVLADIADTEPEGGTNTAAALDRAIELLTEAEQPERDRVILFFTDGQPTHPHGPWRRLENLLMTFDSVSRAADAGIRIHSVGIGAEALEEPLVLLEMARATGGSFTPVRDPSDLVRAMTELAPRTARIALRNDSDERDAIFELGPDGRWAGLVPLGPGENRIAVSLNDGDRELMHRSIALRNDGATPPNPIPDSLVALRNQLLERCLAAARQQRIDTERAAVEQLTRELRLEIERERSRADERAVQQRKSLQIRVEDLPSERRRGSAP